MTKPSKQCDTPISVLKKGQKFGNSRQGGITLVLIHSCSKALQNTWIFFFYARFFETTEQWEITQIWKYETFSFIHSKEFQASYNYNQDINFPCILHFIESFYPTLNLGIHFVANILRFTVPDIAHGVVIEKCAKSMYLVENEEMNKIPL